MKGISLIALMAALCAPSISHAEPSIQVGFSPEGSARQLVLKTIGNATRVSLEILSRFRE
jgi:hypothetical protein